MMRQNGASIATIEPLTQRLAELEQMRAQVAQETAHWRDQLNTAQNKLAECERNAFALSALIGEFKDLQQKLSGTTESRSMQTAVGQLVRQEAP
jgi:flagellar biosynthesis chaperone FliJ